MNPQPTQAEAPSLRRAAENLIDAYRKKYQRDTGSFRKDAPLWSEATALRAALATQQAVQGEPVLIDYEAAHRVAYQAAAAFKPSYFNGPGFVAHSWVVEALRTAHMDGQRFARGLPLIDRTPLADRTATPPAPGQGEPVTDYGIERGDIVTSERWSLTALIVVDVNWALRAVALRLGPNGGVVVWPVGGLKRTGEKADAAVRRPVPNDVLHYAKTLKKEGYRGPLHWARTVIDWVAALDASPNEGDRHGA